MFLKKAFHIINTCDPEIASWSKDGQSFVVKDPDRFATEVIPKCFKHNHFSSFVRQLNFYGFKKLREEHIELDNVDEKKAKWCHFRHPKFQRGRPDLLNQISKNTQKEVADKSELDALRMEVQSLKSVIKNMKSDMGILASMVGQLSKQVQGQNNSDPMNQPPAKKQRVNPPAPSAPAPYRPIAPSTLAPRPAPVSKVAIQPAVVTTATQPPPIVKGKPFSSAERGQSREISSVSLTTEDEEFLTSLFEDESLDKGFEQLPDEVVSS
jgi:hypothetical protein